MKNTTSPIAVYVLDDDPIFTKLLSVALKRFSISCETFNTSAEILSRIHEQMPSLCILDLNVEEKESSLALIRTLRMKCVEIPLLVVSTTSNRQAIAHAIEQGATDFLLKPLDRNILVSKLMRFLVTSELEGAARGFPLPVDFETKVTVGLDVDLTEIDEFGIKVLSKGMVPKGTMIALTGGIISEITARAKPVLVNTASTWIDTDYGLYGAYLEFDLADKELTANVRNWLAARQRKAS